MLKWHSVFVHFKQAMVPEIISKTLYSIYFKVQVKYQQLCSLVGSLLELKPCHIRWTATEKLEGEMSFVNVLIKAL